MIVCVPMFVLIGYLIWRICVRFYIESNENFIRAKFARLGLTFQDDCTPYDHHESWYSIRDELINVVDLSPPQVFWLIKIRENRLRAKLQVLTTYPHCKWKPL
jgi:hypothetical protein